MKGFLLRTLRGFFRALARGLRVCLPLLSPLLSLGVIVLLGYGFWKLGVHNPVGPASKPRPDEQIGVRFYKVELRGRKHGTRFFSIFADRVEVSKDNRYVFFHGKPHGEFFNLKNWEAQLSSDQTQNENTARHLRWEAQRAEYDMQLENLMMFDQVRIITDAGDVVETDEMLWSKQDETLRSSTPSRVLTHQQTFFKADTLEVKTREKEMRLEGNVYLEMYVGKDQKIPMEAPGQ